MKRRALLVAIILLMAWGVALAQDRMIIFFKDGKTQMINLDAIQKIEYQSSAAREIRNLALKRPARQSSSYSHSSGAALAVDGNREGNYFAGSVTHTHNAPNEWWEVDLGTVSQINEVKIFNRTDCCGERLANFYLFVSSQPFPTGGLQEILNNRDIARLHFQGTAGRETTINVNQNGRFVRIQLAGQNWLQLAEVEVMGSESPLAGGQPPVRETLPRLPGLIAWLPGDGNGDDIAGSRPGTPRGGAAFAPGLMGQAFRLDGVDDFIDLGSWVPGPQWTVEAWVNPSATPGGRRTIAGGINECRDWGLAMVNGELAALIKPPGGCAMNLGSGISAAPGRWYHVVATSDGTTAWIYVNGEARKMAAVERNYPGSAAGTRIGGESCCPGNNFPGLIDEVRIYNRALTPKEVLENHNAALRIAGTAPADVVGRAGVPVTIYWHMADNADVYLNGTPLRKYEPTFRTRRDEAPLAPFSAQATLKNGDIFTVGGRRGGSFGLMLIAVDASGRVVFKTDEKSWAVYEPGERGDWFEPAVAAAAPKRPVTVQPHPWHPQREMNARYNNVATSIWGEPPRTFSFLLGTVTLE